MTNSGIVKLLKRGELTIVQIADATDTPIAKVSDVALNYWSGLPATSDVVVTRHDGREGCSKSENGGSGNPGK